MAFDIQTVMEMGISAEQAEKLVAVHEEVKGRILADLEQAKKEVEDAKAQAEETNRLEAEIEAAKAEETDWKKKYETEKAALDSLKAEQAEKNETKRKRGEYRALLVSAGIRFKIADLIARVADVNAYRWNGEAGTFENPEAIKADIATTWGEYRGI